LESSSGEVTIWKISGHLDSGVEDEMLAKIDDLLARRKARVVLDLQNLTLLDSSGVGTLVSLLKRARAMQGEVRAAGLQGQPAEIFELLRLDKAFAAAPTVEAALAELGPPAAR
jgi:anti-anti-sigma factor